MVYRIQDPDHNLKKKDPDSIQAGFLFKKRSGSGSGQMLI